MFMPAKYQPDYVYLRHVPVHRVHLFTVIQVFGMVIMWVFKSTKQVAILFPLMVGRKLQYFSKTMFYLHEINK